MSSAYEVQILSPVFNENVCAQHEYLIMVMAWYKDGSKPLRRIYLKRGRRLVSKIATWR